MDENTPSTSTPDSKADTTTAAPQSSGDQKPPATTAATAADSADDDAGPTVGGFSKGDPVTFGEDENGDPRKALVTFAHGDTEKLDIQLVDDDGNSLLDENQQPRWYPQIDPRKVSHR